MLQGNTTPPMPSKVYKRQWNLDYNTRDAGSYNLLDAYKGLTIEIIRFTVESDLDQKRIKNILPIKNSFPLLPTQYSTIYFNSQNKDKRKTLPALFYSHQLLIYN